MDFFSNWQQPQLFTFFILIIIITALSITIFFKIKSAKVDKAPSVFLMAVESYFIFIDEIVEDSGEGYINKAKPYIFSLFTFFFFGNLLSVVGLEPVGGSSSVTLALGFITWCGIFVVGFIYGKFKFIAKYADPIKLVGAVAPLISISFRMYGNIIGGSVLLLVIYYGLHGLYNLIPLGSFGVFNLPAVIIFPPLLVYFDIFDSTVQAFIFTILTVSYWSMEINEEWPRAIRQQKANKEKLVAQNA